MLTDAEIKAGPSAADWETASDTLQWYLAFLKKHCAYATIDIRHIEETLTAMPTSTEALKDD